MSSMTAATRARFLVLLLLAAAPLSAYLTRIIAASNTAIAEELGVSDIVMGQVLGAFALGYLIFQVPAGALAGWLGARLVLPLAALAWSLCAIGGSLATTAAQLEGWRLALGVAQTALVPGCALVASEWFPPARRGVVGSVISGSMQLGAVLATFLTVSIFAPLGWRGVLQVYAGFGIAWAAVFVVYFRNRPADHSGVNAAELALIQVGRADTGEKKGESMEPWRQRWLVPLASLGLSVTFWAYLGQMFFRAYGSQFFYTWYPAYLEKAFDLGKEEAGRLATWPLVALGVGNLTTGFLLDALLAWTGSRWLSRSGASALGLAVGAACFGGAALVAAPGWGTALLTVGCLFVSVGSPATWAAGIDLGGRHTALVFGVVNMVGNLGGYYSPRHLGALFEEAQASGGSWGPILWRYAGIYLAAGLAWLLVMPPRTDRGEKKSVK